jgi:hypothetical protein
MTSPPFWQENFMDLPYEPKGKWKAGPHSFEAMIQSCHVVRHLLHVVRRNARGLCVLVEEQIRE